MDRKIIKKALTPKEVSEAYGISVGTLANWRCRKVGPRYYRINNGDANSRKVLYMVEDIDTFIRQCPVLTVDSIKGN
jgi:hypothetical protein